MKSTLALAALVTVALTLAPHSAADPQNMPMVDHTGYTTAADS